MKQSIEQEAVLRMPETPTERVVAAVWARFLGLDRMMPGLTSSSLAANPSWPFASSSRSASNAGSPSR